MATGTNNRIGDGEMTEQPLAPVRHAPITPALRPDRLDTGDVSPNLSVNLRLATLVQSHIEGSPHGTESGMHLTRHRARNRTGRRVIGPQARLRSKLGDVLAHRQRLPDHEIAAVAGVDEQRHTPIR